MEVDHELSKRVAKSIGVVRGDCWRNAWLAVTSCPELDGALYTEGWIVSSESLDLEPHAWVEMADCIIDPTIPDAPFAYFPVLRLTISEAIQKTMPDGTHVPDCHQIHEQDLSAMLPIAMHNPDYRQISEKAREEAVTWRRKGNNIPR